METFASGFAQGFIRARERAEDKAQREKDKADALALEETRYKRSRADEKADRTESWAHEAGVRQDQNALEDKRLADARAYQEKQTAFAVANQRQESDFQFKTKLLFERRDERQAAAKKEQELIDSANTLAGGDPELAGTMLKYLKGGLTAAQLQERKDNGDFVKRPDYVRPTQTLQTTYQPSMALPAGVAGPPTPIKTGAEGLGLTEDETKRIGSFGADLLGPGPTPDYKNIDTTGLAYEIKPKNEFKVLPMEQAIKKQEQAIANKDPVAQREAEQDISINKRVETWKTVSSQRAQGKNVATYASIGPDGTIVDRLPGEFREDGKIYNVGDPQNPQAVEGRVLYLSDDDTKRLDKLTDDFGKEAVNVNAAATSYIGALQSTQGMADILQRDHGAATASNNLLNVINNLGGEAQATVRSMQQLEQTIAAKADSNNPDSGIEADIAKYNDLAQKFASSNKGILSDANMQSATNAALYRSYQMQAAYGIAQATSTDGKVSNQDLKNALQIISGSSDPRIVLPQLQRQMQGAFTKLSSMQNNLNNNTAVRQWENQHKIPGTNQNVKTGLQARRVGDMIQELQIPDDQKALLMEYQNSIFAKKVEGQMQTQASVEAQAAQAQQPQQISAPPADAIKELKSMNTPEAKKQFDEIFGPGAADKALGGI